MRAGSGTRATVINVPAASGKIRVQAEIGREGRPEAEAARTAAHFVSLTSDSYVAGEEIARPAGHDSSKVT